MQTTDSIQIPIEGNPADFIADAKKVQEQMDILAHRLDKAGVSQAAYNKAVTNSRAAMDSHTDAIKKTSMSMTDLRSSYMIAMDAVRVGQQIWEQTAGATLKYDEAIRKLAEVSGTGAEESSRLLQVLDDFKITNEDLFVSTKKLKDQGLSPTLDTLAALSDQYRAIQDPVKKVDFLTDNFGKTGLKFAEAMSKGGDALRQMGTEVEKSLIRTDAQIAKTRLAELAFDKYADKIQALKIEIGTSLIGAVDGSNWALQKQAEEFYASRTGADYLTDQIFGLTDAQKEAWEWAQNLATETYLIANGMDVAGNSASELTVDLEAQAAALESLSKANADTLNGAIALTKEHENFASAQDKYIAQMQDLQAEKEEFYPWEVEKIQELEEKQSDLRDEYAKTVEEFKKGMEEKFAMMATEKIAMMDGVAGYSDAEMTRAEAALKTMDVVTGAAMSEQLAMESLTSAVANGQITAQEFGRIIEEAMADGVVSIDEVKKAIDRVPKHNTIVFEIQTTGEIPGIFAPQRPDRAEGQRKHASGGDFMIPMSYGNEGFQMGRGDTASGGETVSITPKGQGQQSKLEIDYGKLSRSIVTAMQQGSSQ